MKMNEVVSQLKGIKHELGDIVPPEVIDRVLESMGLQVRRSSFRGFASGTGIFLAGIVIGGAAALLLAPKAGLELRGDLEDKLDTVIEKLKGLVGQKTEGEEETAGGKSASSTSSTKTTTPSDKNKEGNQAGKTSPGGMHS